MAIDYATAVGQLRLLISDVDEDNLILTDAMIGGYLSMRGITATAQDASLAGVKRAAADALDAIATSEALVSKVIRTQDLSTNGPQTAASLREHAARLRAQATTDEDDESGDGGIEVVEFSPYPELDNGWY